MRIHLHDRQHCSQVDCDNVIEYGDYCEYYDNNYTILCQRCEEAKKRTHANKAETVTPYQRHAAVAAAEPAEHHSVRASPDSFQIIEECSCGQRWLHDSVIGYPLTLSVAMGCRSNASIR